MLKRVVAISATAAVCGVMLVMPSASAATLPVPTLLPPLGAASLNAPTLSDVELQWSAVPGATSYVVQLSRFSTFQSVYLSSQVVGTRWAPDSSLLNGMYWWRVIATAGGVSSVSAISEFRRVWGPQTEPAPTDLSTVTDPNTGYIGSVAPVLKSVLSTDDSSATATTLSSNPSAPSLVAANQLEMQWQPMARASYYEVYVYNQATADVIKCTTPYTFLTATNSSPTTPVGMNQMSADQYQPAGACALGDFFADPKHGSEYTWQVRAVDLPAGANYTSQPGDGLLTSAWSGSDAFQITASTTSATGMTPAAGTTVTGSPTLAWQADTGAPAHYLTSYVVDIGLDSQFTNGVVALATNSAVLRPNGLLADNDTTDSYFWKVAVIYTLDTSYVPPIGQAPLPTVIRHDLPGVSNFEKISLQQVVTAATPVAYDNGNDMHFGWSALPLGFLTNTGGFTGYLTQILSSKGVVVWSSKTDSPFVDTQSVGRFLTPGTYSIRTAVYMSLSDKPANLTDWSTPVTFTKVGSTVILGSPTFSKVVAGNGQVTLTWSPPAALGTATVTSYAIQSSAYSTSMKKWTAFATVRTTTSTNAAIGAINGVAYQFRVIATTSVGVTAPSAVAAATPAGRPYAPFAISGSSAHSHITVSWSRAVSNGSVITGYVLQYSMNGATFRTLQTLRASTLSGTLYNVVVGRAYYFRVYTTSSLGNSTYSSKIKVIGRN